MRETLIPVPGTGGLQVTLHHADDPRAVLVLTHGFGEHSGRYGRTVWPFATRWRSGPGRRRAPEPTPSHGC